MRDNSYVIKNNNKKNNNTKNPQQKQPKKKHKKLCATHTNV